MLLYLFGTKLLILPAVVGAGIAAGASLAGSGASIYASGKMNKKTREFSEKMYGKQRADALADWDTQNAYNSPEAQMARLKAAGLNPNLVYGSGSATEPAGRINSTESKGWNPNTPDLSGISRAGSEGLQAFQDVTLQQEQVKTMVAQRENIKLDAALKAVQLSTDGINNAQTKLDLDRSRELYDTSISAAKEQLRALTTSTGIKITQEVRDAAMHAPTLAAAIERVAAISSQTDVSKQQLENLKKSGVLQQMEINMRKLGLSYNDGVILRMLAQFAQGQSLPEVIKNLYDKVRDMATDMGKPVKEETEVH